jgi:hypothetical protein
MDSIIEYRNDRPAINDYPRRIVSPTTPSACCWQHMERVGRPAFDATWRFYYKRCSECGYAVRCFYAQRILALLDAAREIKLALAEMNLGAGKRKRRTQAEIDAEIAAAGHPAFGRGEPVAAPRARRVRRSLMPLRSRKPIPSPA